MAPLSFRFAGPLLLACSIITPAAVAVEPQADDEAEEPGIEFNWAPGDARVVAAYAPDAAYTLYSRVIAGGQVVFNDDWSLDAVFRFDGYFENRNDGADYRNLTDLKLDGQNVMLSWVGESSRLSAGYGIVRWGKTDEISPVDRVVAADFTRFNLNTIEERRRAVPLLRWQWFGEDINVDMLYRPWFRKARMPAFKSIWSPVDRRDGRIAGFPDDDPALIAAVKNLPFKDSAGGSGGAAARVSGLYEGIDWGLSLQRQRRSTPYYRVEEDNGKAIFVGKHPFRWIAGGEMAMAIGKLTMRAEAVYMSAEPVTREDGSYQTVPAWEAVAGIDWWPGDKDTLVVVQLATRWLDTSEPVKDQVTTVALTGSVNTEWGRGDWEARGRYFVALNQNEYYFNPYVTWKRFAPHELIVGAHVFGGSERTVMGYYDDNDQVYLEWKLSW